MAVGATAHVVAHHHHASVGGTISQLLSSAGKFFSSLASLSLLPLLIGLVCYALYLALRSRALFNAVRAAYPDERVRWRDVWGGYMAGYAVNNVFPLGGGNIVQLFLTRLSIERSSYPALASALSTGVIFDWAIGLLVMGFAFTQGVFPKPPSFAQLPSFDISFFASNPRFTLFALTAAAIGFLVLFALLSARVKAFWQRIRQGFSILRDRRRYRREMASWQAASWVARFAAYWAFLDAFHIGGSVTNALLVLAVQVIASVFPFTPGGAGVQQALLATIFAHRASGSTVAAFSVGQQIATAVLSGALGFAALVFIFRFRSFREVIRRGREHRRAEAGGASGVGPEPGAVTTVGPEPGAITTVGPEPGAITTAGPEPGAITTA
ncbi:MAG TPA: lysylphosphatidylglycerol synthase transmembrane domain-containing protein [Solirubrobacteraceae bacterium]|nr:lysylphosphatidylglycerol synthase transmembrane domain-containing protein [Solirubrobacteraceae bacterium]